VDRGLRPGIPRRTRQAAGNYRGDGYNRTQDGIRHSDAEFEAATTPNMDVIIKKADQPEAAKLEKGNPVRFTGTLESYDPDPAFMLHWDKAK